MCVRTRSGPVPGPVKAQGIGRQHKFGPLTVRRALRYILSINEKLIANVGVTVWLTLMVMYSTKFPVFAIAGASTTGFGLLYQYLSSKTTGWNLKGSNEHFVNALTTAFHATAASILAYYSLYSEYDTLYTDLRQNSSVLSKTAVGFAVGYFAYDLWHIVHADMVRQSPALMIHHLAILGIYTTVIIESQFYPYMVLTLLCEPHSMFMQLRKITKVLFDVPRGLVTNRLQSNIYWALWALNILTCVFTRMLPHGCILYNVYVAKEDKQLFPQSWMFNCAFGGMIMINAINCGLFVNIYHAYKKDVRLVRKEVERKPR